MKNVSETSSKMMPKSIKLGIGCAVENHGKNIPRKYEKVENMGCQTGPKSE
jgi:hypothetical protein